jgi:hypothetical protein
VKDAQRRLALDAAVELTHFAYRADDGAPDALLAARGLSRVHHRILHFVVRFAIRRSATSCARSA